MTKLGCGPYRNEPRPRASRYRRHNLIFPDDVFGGSLCAGRIRLCSIATVINELNCVGAGEHLGGVRLSHEINAPLPKAALIPQPRGPRASTAPARLSFPVMTVEESKTLGPAEFLRVLQLSPTSSLKPLLEFYGVSPNCTHLTVSDKERILRRHFVLRWSEVADVCLQKDRPTLHAKMAAELQAALRTIQSPKQAW